MAKLTALAERPDDDIPKTAVVHQLSDTEKVLAGCLAAFIAPLLITYSIIASAYVLTVLWAWFIVFQFDTAPLTIPYAIGLSLISNLLLPKVSHSKNDSSWSFLTISFIQPWAILFVGWIVHTFFM